MRLRKYHINPDTLALEHIEQGIIYWLRRFFWHILIGVALGIAFFFVFYWIFPSPNEAQLRAKQRDLETNIEALSQRANQMQLVMSDLQQRDDNLYRVLLGADPVSLNARTSTSRRMAYYDSISKMTNSQLTAELFRKMDQLEHEIYMQSKSYDEVLQLAKTQEERMACLPAIQPVLNQDLKRLASGYGYRIDPIYHVRRFHSGMDFTAPKGTDIYATGNARVVFVGWKQGYGNTVILDHGMGYTTLYAHLFKQLVSQGQRVQRGDVIALMGSTGKSTGPHLHYEVRINDKPVDPRNFYFYDLSPEQYDQMVQLCENYGDMLD